MVDIRAGYRIVQRCLSVVSFFENSDTLDFAASTRRFRVRRSSQIHCFGAALNRGVEFATRRKVLIAFPGDRERTPRYQQGIVLSITMR